MNHTKIVNGQVIPLTTEEAAELEARKSAWEAGANDRAAADVRNQRDALIAATDWWVLPDRTASSEQLAYRQALRDITTQDGFPHSVVWPTKPE